MGSGGEPRGNTLYPLAPLRRNGNPHTSIQSHRVQELASIRMSLIPQAWPPLPEMTLEDYRG